MNSTVAQTEAWNGLLAAFGALRSVHEEETRARYATLLKAFLGAKKAGAVRPAPHESIENLRLRLDEIRRGLSVVSGKRLQQLSRIVSDSIEGVRRREEGLLKGEAASSPRLNPWSVLGLASNENSHSDMLRWLFDRRESHAQGPLFLRAFAKALSEPLPETCFTEPYRVHREVSHERSRIDIEVLGQTFLLHIEVKVYSLEGSEQIVREAADLERKAAERGIARDRVRGVFLTRHGDAPQSGETTFKALRWGTVVEQLADAVGELRKQHPSNIHLPWLIERYCAVISEFSFS